MVATTRTARSPTSKFFLGVHADDRNLGRELASCCFDSKFSRLFRALLRHSRCRPNGLFRRGIHRIKDITAAAKRRDDGRRHRQQDAEEHHEPRLARCLLVRAEPHNHRDEEAVVQVECDRYKDGDQCGHKAGDGRFLRLE